MEVPLEYDHERKYCCASHRDHLLLLRQTWLSRLRERAELQLITAIEREAAIIGRFESTSREILFAIADRLEIFQELAPSVKHAALDQSMMGHTYDVQNFARILGGEYGDSMKVSLGLEN